MFFAVKIIGVFFFMVVSSSCGWAGEKNNSSNLISDQKALQIAEESLVKTYGKDVLSQRPFKIVLDKEVWNIEGTFHCSEGTVCKGGTAQIQVSAKSGKVLKVTHEK